MSSTSDDLLRQVMTGEVAPTAESVVKRCREDSGFAEALVELQGVREELDAVGRFDREILDDAAQSRTAEDTLEVRESLRVGLRKYRRRAVLRRWAPVAAAALVLLMSAMWWLQSTDEDQVPKWNQTLGEGSDVIVAPTGEVAAFETLEVDYDALKSARTVEVEVISAATGEVLARRSGAGDKPWRFTKEEQVALTRAGHVRVRALVTSLSGEEEEFTTQARLISGLPGTSAPR